MHKERLSMSEFKIDVAVIGCGYWGKNLVRNFHEIGALKAICDFDPTTAEKFALQYEVQALSLQEILNANDIQAVVIAAPAAQHFNIAKQALEKGKHVFVEKPLSLSVKEGEELCEIAKQNDLILMVGHLLHYHSAYQSLKTLVEDGTLGDLRYIYSNRLNLGKVRREEDILWSFAPHDISMILDLMGEEPKNVDAKGGFYLSENIADVTTTHLTFSNNRKAHIFVSWLHPFKEQKLVVVGSKAMAVFIDGEPWNQKLQLYKHNIDITDETAAPLIDKADVEYVDVPESEPLKNECLHFLESINTKAQPITNGEEGLRVLKVLEASTSAIEKHNEQSKLLCA